MFHAYYICQQQFSRAWACFQFSVMGIKFIMQSVEGDMMIHLIVVSNIYENWLSDWF